MLVIEVERISISEVLILFSGLSLASIALLAEGEVDVVAVETEPVAFAGLVVGFGLLGGGLAIFDRGGVVELHKGIWLWEVGYEIYFKILIYLY